MTVPALCALKMWGQELLYLYHEGGEKNKTRKRFQYSIRMCIEQLPQYAEYVEHIRIPVCI